MGAAEARLKRADVTSLWVQICYNAEGALDSNECWDSNMEGKLIGRVWHGTTFIASGWLGVRNSGTWQYGREREEQCSNGSNV